MVRINGKLVGVYGKSFHSPGLIDRHLEVYVTQTKIKGILFRSVVKGWRTKNNILSSIHITDENPISRLDEVLESFGFEHKNKLR
jgi:hypothetical protein